MHHSPLQTWNAPFRISAGLRSDMRSALRRNLRTCSARPALTQWGWQTTIRSILALKHCRILQRACFRNKLSQSELKRQPKRLAIRVFSRCPMEKESLCLRSTVLTLSQLAKSSWHLFAQSLAPELRKRVHTQTLSFALFTGESKTAIESLMNSATSP